MLLIKGHCRIRYPWFDSGGSLGLFRLSDVCRLMVAISIYIYMIYIKLEAH